MDLCREGEQQDSVELLQVLLGKGIKLVGNSAKIFSWKFETLKRRPSWRFEPNQGKSWKSRHSRLCRSARQSRLPRTLGTLQETKQFANCRPIQSSGNRFSLKSTEKNSELIFSNFWQYLDKNPIHATF